MNGFSVPIHLRDLEMSTSRYIVNEEVARAGAPSSASAQKAEVERIRGSIDAGGAAAVVELAAAPDVVGARGAAVPDVARGAAGRRVRSREDARCVGAGFAGRGRVGVRRRVIGLATDSGLLNKLVVEWG
mmetsp:Transcript_20696/g.65093  ORF Transcript_20696/g.65093 Transcript_20696/m.65093 type:complete len:130 (+) Transcript_20696:177-566(+)